MPQGPRLLEGADQPLRPQCVLDPNRKLLSLNECPQKAQAHHPCTRLDCGLPGQDPQFDPEQALQCSWVQVFMGLA